MILNPIKDSNNNNNNNQRSLKDILINFLLQKRLLAQLDIWIRHLRLVNKHLISKHHIKLLHHINPMLLKLHKDTSNNKNNRFPHHNNNQNNNHRTHINSWFSHNINNRDNQLLYKFNRKTQSNLASLLHLLKVDILIVHIRAKNEKIKLYIIIN